MLAYEKVAYLRAADNVSRLLPIWLRGVNQLVMALQEGTCDITPFSLLHCHVTSYRLIVH